MILNDRWVESSSWGLGNINQFMETECSFSIPRRKELKQKKMTPFHTRKILHEDWSRAWFPRGSNNGMCSALQHGLRRQIGGEILACSVKKTKDCDRKGRSFFSWETFVQSTPGFLLEIVLAPHVRVGGKCIIPAKAFICISMVGMDIFFTCIHYGITELTYGSQYSYSE